MPIYEPNSVVLNEISWGGTLASNSPSDEWFELYNTTDHDIIVDDWRIVSILPDTRFLVVLSGKIPAKGYFLLEQNDDTVVSDIAADMIYIGDMLDEGMALLILAPDGTEIASVNRDGGQWPGGIRLQTVVASMERIDPLGLDVDSNWGTNNTVIRNGFDADDNPLNGTPKAPNSLTPQ